MDPAERDPRSKEAALIAEQRGIVTTRQLTELGLSRSAISRRVVSGRLVKVLPGVLRSPAVPISALQGILAATLWAGPHSTVSHTTAAALWRLDGATSERVELWVPNRRRLDSVGVVVHRGALDPIDIRMRDGIRLTSPARTLLDIASRLDDEDFEAAAESAFRRGITNPTSVRRRLDAFGRKGRAGSGRLREFLERRGDAAALEYRLEVKVWRLLCRAGVRPVRQYEVTSGGVTRRLDFAWPALKVAVEANGFDAHGGRLAQERDYRRAAWLVARGWRIVPVSWRRVTEEPELFVADVVAALRSAAA